ncbi:MULTISPECIES: amidohydrolase family protein [Olivibacter]|uniref:Amidohydrolase family protein n=1 Tax=Olivibacter jilunii TaxID=985016 RepID=A0ABW6B0B7_9SPHI|nr:amidohydrolase family protein [Olivibacter sp. UJ_SKK_5.1]
MVNYYSADYILPVSAKPIHNGIIGVDENGEIIGVYESGAKEISDKTITKHKGIITPGFINTHCHLELSHLKGKFAKGTGLIPFIEAVIGQRNANEKEVVKAMQSADSEMKRNGIVAVGDIANRAISKETKEKSSLYYHTFIEILCFEPEKAQEVFRDGLALCETFDGLPSSITPHAPYSVCKEIFRFLKQLHKPETNLLSIHNQESEEENKLYRYKSGQFIDFYRKLNRDIGFFKAQARDSIQTIVPLLPKRQPVMFVHNTYTNMKDIFFVDRFAGNVTWCICPNANLYIENRLPKIDLFLNQDSPITLGTDSLASNDKLCILSELLTLHAHFPHLKLEDTLKWATLNGAKYLGIDHQYGSLEKGKKPGLNLISHTQGLKLSENSTVTPLI